MIKLYDVLLTDIMPVSLLSDDMEAYALTIRDVIRLIIEKADKIAVYKNFEKQSDEVINLLAAEYRSHYYDENLSLEQRRELVKNTWQWYIKAGTDGAVNDMLKILFGRGQIIPWYEYGGEPYHVKITANIDYSEDIMEKFNEILKRVKKASTVLDEISTKNVIESELHIGVKMLIPDKVIYQMKGE